MQQRIIDIHTHIYPYTLAGRALKVVHREHDMYEKLPIKENLLRIMREENIAYSVVQHVVSKPKTQTDVNRFAKESLRYGLRAFGGLHPDCANVCEELEKLKDMDLSGVKFHPPFQEVDLFDDKYREMWERINALGFPVLIHCGPATEIGYEHQFGPANMPKVLKWAPDVPFILAHTGGRYLTPEDEKLMYSLPENVFIDTAMSAERQDIRVFERIAEGMGPERVLMGSDFPYGSQRAAIDFILKSHFSDHEKELMLGGNAERIFKGLFG